MSSCGAFAGHQLEHALGRQRLQVVLHAAGLTEPEGLGDLGERRGAAFRRDVLAEEVEDGLLAVGECHATNLCGSSSDCKGRGVKAGISG